jgi:hypothetical protein
VSEGRSEAGIYLSHVVALLFPGRKVSQHAVVPTSLPEMGDLTSWSEDDLTLMIEECRLALASQETRFDRVRTTAQVVLPVASVILVVVAGELRVIARGDPVCVRLAWLIPWFFATGCVLLAALGAAAILSVRSDFGMIYPPLLSTLESPIKPQLAHEYVRQISIGEITIGTRITVIRDAIALLSYGGVVYVVLWLFRVLF